MYWGAIANLWAAAAACSSSNSSFEVAAVAMALQARLVPSGGVFGITPWHREALGGCRGLGALVYR